MFLNGLGRIATRRSMGMLWYRAFSTQPEPQVPDSTPRRQHSRSNFVPTAILFVATGIGLYFYFQHVNEETNKRRHQMTTKVVGSYGDAKVGGPFSLTTHKGDRVTDESFRGKYLLVYFGFTNCPDICPDELDKLTNVIQILDKRRSHALSQREVLPIFITVDPKRDSPEQVAAYLKDFHPKFIGLTGSPQEIMSVCKAYRVYYSKTALESGPGQEAEDYLVDHSVFFYLMDPQGHFVEFYGRELNSTEIADKVTKHLEATQ